jgi:hypothetical protein
MNEAAALPLRFPDLDSVVLVPADRGAVTPDLLAQVK